MSYYPVDYSASGQPRIIRNGRLPRRLGRSQRVPTGVYDEVHSPLKYLTFFFFGTHMPGSLWPRTCRVMSQLKSRILLPRVVYQTENSRGSAQNLRSGRFNLEFRGHPPSGAIPQLAASFVQAGSPCVRAARQYLPCFEDDPIQQRPSRKQPSAPHGCGRSLNCHTIGTIWNGASPRKKRQSGMTFLRIVIPLYLFCWRMISGQTPRVCPEGKPEPTPHQVRGRLFPDHALVRPSHRSDFQY